MFNPSFPQSLEIEFLETNQIEKLDNSILILEDDIRFGIRIRSFFEEQGYRATLCKGVSQADDFLEINSVFAAIVDVYLGEVGGNPDGVKFVSRVRRQHPEVFLVGMSAISSSQAIDKMKLICDAFVRKPLDLEHLKELIDEGIRNRMHHLLKWLWALSGSANPVFNQWISPGLRMPDEELSDDPNFLAYQEMQEELKRRYMGEYVAFVHGRLVGHGIDRKRLISTVYHEYREANILVQMVQENLEVVRRRPRRLVPLDE